MNLPRFLAARFLRPEGAFLSFVTVAAAGGIALAVAPASSLSPRAVALFALGTCPRKSIPVTSGERNIPLTFGGVTFTPGEYLYGDRDGVIVCAEKIV